MLYNYSNEEKEILVLISNMINSDIPNKAKTEKTIMKLAEKNYEKIIYICNKFALNEKEKLEIRYYSLILLNNLINKEKGKNYNLISEKIKEELRANCLGLLGNKEPLIRQFSSIVVSSLGKITKTVNQNEWPDLIPLLCDGCDSKNKIYKLSAIKTLKMIWEYFPNGKDAFTMNEVNRMETSLIKMLSSPLDSEIALEALKAYKTFINYISDKFVFSDYLKNTFKLILHFCKKNNNNTIQVATNAIHCVIEIIKSAYIHMDPLVSELFKFFGQLCIGNDEELAIQSYIFFTEVSLEEIERKKEDEEENEKGINYKNYIEKNWNILFFCIKDTVKNYQNNKDNINENGEYTRYKALSNLLYNISLLCNENIVEEIYKYSFQKMNETDVIVVNSGVFIFTSILDSNHNHLIIQNLSKIIPHLCKFLTVNCILLNTTVGECLEKICEKYGGLIIGDKSLFVSTSFLLAKLLTMVNLKNKIKINLCLCICDLCNHIKSSSLQHLGLFSPYLNDLLTLLDSISYKPTSYEHNYNLSYYSFSAILNLLDISNSSDKLALQNYFQILYQRLTEAKDISNFKGNKEKQYLFQDYLCLCLNKYCNEGNNNASLETTHIIYFFKIIENFFELRKEIFESGLLSLAGLIIVFSKIKKEENENDFLYMIDITIKYILTNISKYNDIESLNTFFYCLRQIIQSCGEKIEKNVKKIVETMENIGAFQVKNIKVIGKIIMVYSDLISNENKVIWNYFNNSLTWLANLIKESINEYDTFMTSKMGYENFCSFIDINDSIIEFLEEILHKILLEKQELKIVLINYEAKIMEYFNKIFNNGEFVPQNEFIVSSINCLIDLIDLYDQKIINLIERNSLNNLYNFAENSKDDSIIEKKDFLNQKITSIKNRSINKLL